MRDWIQFGQRGRVMRSGRLLLLVSGLLLMLISLSADKIGFSAHGSFGEGQVLLVIFGTLLAVAGAAGNKFILVWRYFGLLLSVCILAVVFLLALRSLSKQSTRTDDDIILPSIFPEREDSLFYRPHVIWTGEEMDPSPSLFREDSVWIYGAVPVNPENETLPDSIREYLREGTLDRRQPMYNSTQSLILLMMDLRRYPPPSCVILTAGDADVRAAFSTGDPRWPMGSTRIMRALGSSGDLSMGLNGQRLAEMITRVQITNRRVLEALGRSYGFRPVFIWNRTVADTSMVDSVRIPGSLSDSLVRND